MDFREKAEKACCDWNRENPIGTVVEYYGTAQAGKLLCATRSTAYVAPDNCAVIYLADKAGPVMLKSCRRVG